MKKSDFSYYLMNFLSHYLPNEKGNSKNTISSYRYCFILLFEFLRTVRNISPQKLNFDDLDKNTITEFLDWLEKERTCSISTRNQRLAAISSFFKYVSGETPDYLFQCQQILSIPIKRAPKPVIDYLTTDEMQALLAIPTQTRNSDFRDLVLLSLMYDSAARVQEICDLTPKNINMEQSNLSLTGKGQKTRVIPLMEKTVKLLRRYMQTTHLDIPKYCNEPFFPNKYNQKMTRAGVAYILDKYVKMAKVKHSSWFKGSLHPHCLRHSRAIHMLQADVPIHYIRDFLGHESIQTTEIYAKTNNEAMKKALEKTHKYNSIPEEKFSWREAPDTLAWLKNLSK